jgi:hypothetical protein
MLKKVLVAAAVGGLIASMALPAQAARAARHAAEPGAGPMTCKQAAKLKYPSDLRARHAYKHECKTAWKASHKKAA